MRHVITAWVINEPGVLANVAGMFAARGFNIDSLVVGRTEDPNLSRMTIVVDADDNTLEQVRKQLAKLVPVTKVRDFAEFRYVERDLALISVNATAETRGQIIDLVNVFQGKICDVSDTSVIVELAGAEDKIEDLIELLRKYGKGDAGIDWQAKAQPPGRRGAGSPAELEQAALEQTAP